MVPMRGVDGFCEERVTTVRAGRRKDIDLLTPEQGADLPRGLPHGRRRCDHLRTHPAPFAQCIDRRFVQSDDGTERTRDEVQLVLDDKVGRWKWAAQRPPDAWAPRSVESGGIATVDEPE